MAAKDCKRCKGSYGDGRIKGGICGSCADDLRGELRERIVKVVL